MIDLCKGWKPDEWGFLIFFTISHLFYFIIYWWAVSCCRSLHAVSCIRWLPPICLPFCFYICHLFFILIHPLTGSEWRWERMGAQRLDCNSRKEKNGNSIKNAATTSMSPYLDTQFRLSSHKGWKTCACSLTCTGYLHATRRLCDCLRFVIRTF